MPITEISIVIFAYLLGSISSAVIVCRLMGLTDPRNVGSSNPGATNVLRTGGKKAAIITFCGDLLKGIIPVLIAKSLNFEVLWLTAVAIAAFIGHCIPIFFSFRGGKGVATAFGAVTTMNWQIGLILLLAWSLVFFIFKISSLAGISGGLALPPASWFLAHESFLPMTMMALLMIWRHQDNIRDLLKGEERSFKN